MNKNSNLRLHLLVPSVIILGLISSFIAKLLTTSISFFTHLFYFQEISTSPISPGENHLGYFSIFVPVVGGLIVGLLARFGSSAIRGHGIPEAMENILLKESRVPKKILILKPLSAAISIGSGGPFGAEGPIIATGGALGSMFGTRKIFSSYERKILLASGAAAGMSAIFGTPLAAVLLAIELLLFEYRALSFIPVAIAAALAAIIRNQFLEGGSFMSLGEIAEINVFTFMILIFAGSFFGVISVVTTEVVYWIEDIFEKLPIHWMWWPMIGGLFVGVIGILEPKTLGVGYSNIQMALEAKIALSAALSLLIFKFVSWAISLGSGTSGGTLAPLLTVGSLSGFILGHIGHSFVPEVNSSLLALVGMASVFAGASHALLASIVFAVECTQRVETIIPLMIGCCVSYIVSRAFMKHSIMTKKIIRRGVVVPSEYRG